MRRRRRRKKQSKQLFISTWDFVYYIACTLLPKSANIYTIYYTCIISMYNTQQQQQQKQCYEKQLNFYQFRSKEKEHSLLHAFHVLNIMEYNWFVENLLLFHLVYMYFFPFWLIWCEDMASRKNIECKHNMFRLMKESRKTTTKYNTHTHTHTHNQQNNIWLSWIFREEAFSPKWA